MTSPMTRAEACNEMIRIQGEMGRSNKQWQGEQTADGCAWVEQRAHLTWRDTSLQTRRCDPHFSCLCSNQSSLALSIQTGNPVSPGLSKKSRRVELSRHNGDEQGDERQCGSLMHMQTDSEEARDVCISEHRGVFQSIDLS